MAFDSAHASRDSSAQIAPPASVTWRDAVPMADALPHTWEGSLLLLLLLANAKMGGLVQRVNRIRAWQIHAAMTSALQQARQHSGNPDSFAPNSILVMERLSWRHRK